jgi:hypothetical protein
MKQQNKSTGLNAVSFRGCVDFAGGPQKFFEQALYREYSTEPRNPSTDVLVDNPATRALAQMEGD